MADDGLDLNSAVGDWIVRQPSLARVFERHGIDYCCGGKRALAVACRAAAVSAEEVLTELRMASATAPTPMQDWQRAPLGDLCRHIESTHHAYLRTELPRLGALLTKVIRAHGARYSELEQLGVVFAAFRAELEQHMYKEERVLFPAICEIESASEAPRRHCGSINNPISVMQHEHDNAGAALRKMRALTYGYALPENACNTYRALFAGLAELEQDMHTHVHKENNILFPRAAQREAQLGVHA